MSFAASPSVGERLRLPDESDLGREPHRDRERVGAVLEVGLASGQGAGKVARAQASMIAQAEASWAGAASSSTSRLPDLLSGGPGR